MFFFHHYFAVATFLVFVITLTDRRTRTVPYLFFLGFITPSLLLSCWVGLWLSWASFLGGFFLIKIVFVCTRTRGFRSCMVLVGHLLFLLFLVLVLFFNFSSHAFVMVWLFVSELMSFFYFSGAGVINFCSILYLQTEPIYAGSAYYLPLTRLVFSLYSSYSTLAFLDPVFVFICVFVMYFYG